LSPKKGYERLLRPSVADIAPYRPGKRGSEMRREAGLEQMVKLSSNESALPPFPKAIEALKSVAGRVNRYPDSYSTILRERLAEHLGVPSTQVCLGNGSNELITLIAQAVLSPGLGVVTCWPSFVVYPIVSQMMEAELTRVPLDAGWRFDLDAMADAITAKTRLVFVCNPNNPTGTIVTKDEVERFMARVPDHVVVVFDEAYFEYVDDPDYGGGMPYFDGSKPVVVLRTFSKMYALAGLRVGYGAFPEWLAGAIEKLREPFNVNLAAQVAAYYSLGDEAEVARRKAIARAQIARIYGTLDRLGLRYEPTQANFVAFDAGDPEAALAVFEGLVKRGVIVRGFGPSPLLRATVGTKEDTDAFISGLEAVMAEQGGSPKAGVDG
jgi:histidinol-phosphate aminotransferase